MRSSRRKHRFDKRVKSTAKIIYKEFTTKSRAGVDYIHYKPTLEKI